MNKHSFLFFSLVAAFGLVLFLFSTINGFTSKNAIVVSRGLTIKATIDGIVKATSPDVGTRITTGAALVTIENTRMDQSTIYELRAELEANTRRHELISNHIKDSSLLVAQYAQKSSSYTDWYTQDLRYTHQQQKLKLSTAQEESKLSEAAASRGILLSQSGHIVQRDLDRLERNAFIDKNKVELIKREIAQIENRLNILSSKGFIFSSDGNADYWTRMTDELQLDLMSQKNSMLDLELTIEKLNRRLEWESRNIANESREIHHSPFEGVINAVFSSKGDLVTAETPLLQILDCANPIAIVSVKESSLGNFSVGQRATITPIDTSQTYHGYVQYISNGPLISQDISLAIPSDVSQDGSKIIVAFDRDPDININKSCDAARRAVVSIDTNGVLQRHVSGLKSILSRVFVNQTPEITNNTAETPDIADNSSEPGAGYTNEKLQPVVNFPVQAKEVVEPATATDARGQLKTILASLRSKERVYNLNTTVNPGNVLDIPSHSTEERHQDAEWVLSQPGTHYTIQVGTTTNRKFLRKFANSLPGDQPVAVFAQHLNRSNMEVYALIYGSFQSYELANSALTQLNQSARRYGAYTRSFNAINSELEKLNTVTAQK